MTGGHTLAAGDSRSLASTILLIDGYDEWTQVGDLPVALTGLRAVTLNNNIFIIGSIIYVFFNFWHYFNDIHCRRKHR